MWAGAWILLPLLLALHMGSGAGQEVQTDSIKLGLVGSETELRCVFQNSRPPHVNITQVAWLKFLSNGTRQNVAVANPDHGATVLPAFEGRVRFKQAAAVVNGSRLDDVTVVFSDLRPSDAAAYVCAYTTFPLGVLEGRVSLGTVSLTARTVVVAATPQERDNATSTLATCRVTTDGKFLVAIEWDTAVAGEGRETRDANDDGTVTVGSDYVVAVPSRQTHGQEVTCVVTYGGDAAMTRGVALDVQYRPEVEIDGFDGNWHQDRRDVRLTCRADANPPVSTYRWTRLNGSLPHSAEIVQNHTLFFSGSVTYDVAGTYVCQAANDVGTGSASVEVYVSEAGNAGVAIGLAVGGGALLLAAAAVVLLVFYLRRQKRRQATGNKSYWLEGQRERVFGL